MLNKFTKFIDEHKLFSHDDELLVAVSGGVDSMVLCELLLAANYKFSVAHCNFQLRGEDSDEDEKFVKDFCLERGVECFVKKFETQEIAEQTKKSIQVVARDLRYNWFSELLNEHQNLKFIATAHHASDNIETVLFHIAKGTGLKGLTGIPTKDERKIVRPMLFAFKNEILEFAQSNSISFREDISNASDKYSRNFIRHHIVPAFEKINPSFEKTFDNSMSVFNQTYAFYKDVVSDIEKKCVSTESDSIVIDWEKISENAHQHILLYEFLSPYNFNADQVAQIISVLETETETGKKFFSDSHELLLNRKKFLCAKLFFQKKNSEKKFQKKISKKILKKFLKKKFQKKISEKKFLKSNLFFKKKI